MIKWSKDFEYHIACFPEDVEELCKRYSHLEKRIRLFHYRMKQESYRDWLRENPATPPLRVMAKTKPE